ncbi:uncharacterized protein LOC121973026 [Zingiber officinale]|uniref:uncharacterized protein LOC121973026 n=1 Tax=Zingiber officinale TaxID=94328 RepID=UPI001C4CB62F|nr:uncharacterized protein LOC121973026 [Zingiber officinale]
MATSLKKGSRVEVIQRNSSRWIPPYSWHCAVLLTVMNSRQFIVKYDDSKMGLQFVPRDWIRPRPPPFVGRFPWRAGDMVEVFEDYAWWPANVVDVIINGANRIISVWPLNSMREIRARPSKIRLRKQWTQEQNWSIIDEFTNYEYRLETEEDFPYGVGGGKAPACDDRESCNTTGRKRRRSTDEEEEEEELRQRLRRITVSLPSPASSTDYDSSDSSSSSMDDSPLSSVDSSNLFL